MGPSSPRGSCQLSGTHLAGAPCGAGPGLQTLGDPARASFPGALPCGPKDTLHAGHGSSGSSGPTRPAKGDALDRSSALPVSRGVVGSRLPPSPPRAASRAGRAGLRALPRRCLSGGVEGTRARHGWGRRRSGDPRMRVRRGWRAGAACVRNSRPAVCGCRRPALSRQPPSHYLGCRGTHAVPSPPVVCPDTPGCPQGRCWDTATHTQPPPHLSPLTHNLKGGGHPGTLNN